MIHPSILHRVSEIRAVMQEHKVLKAYLFGSAVTADFGQDSDIDLLVDVDTSMDPVELGAHQWDIQFSLEDILGRKVDLFTSRSLQNPFFIQQVESTKELIYECYHQNLPQLQREVNALLA
jgi:uncharacterized protein